MTGPRRAAALLLVLVAGCFGRAGPGEGDAPRTLWVATSNSTGRIDGSRAGPFLAIADALAVARKGDVIRVTAGTYAETLTIPVGVTLKGDDPATTIVQGSGSARVITVAAGVGPVRIEGLTIQGGYSSHSSALFATGSAVTLRECLFTGNATGDDANGSEQYLAATVRLATQGTYRVERCVFLANVGTDLVLDQPASAVVVNDVFSMATRAAIHVRGDPATLAFDARITNVTIHGAASYGVLMDGGSNARLTNVVAVQCGRSVQENAKGGDPVLRYCCLADAYSDVDSGAQITDPALLNALDPPGTNVGNLMRDPQLADPAGGDYRLAPASPCIDRGDPALVDADGSRSDMGAFGGPGGTFGGVFALAVPTAFAPAPSVHLDLPHLFQEPGGNALAGGAVQADADGDGWPETWSIQDGRLVAARPGATPTPAPTPLHLDPVLGFTLYDLDDDGRLDALVRSTSGTAAWLQRPGVPTTVPVRGRPGDRVEAWHGAETTPRFTRTIGPRGDRDDGAVLMGVARDGGTRIVVWRDGAPVGDWPDVRPATEALVAHD